MRRFLLALCGATMIAAAPVVHAQGISKGIGSFPTPPDQTATPPTIPPPPPASGRATGLLASDPESIQAAIQAEGFQAKLGIDSDGDPVITGSILNSDYWIYFLSCDDNGANCEALKFHTGIRLSRRVTTEEMNEFNSNWLYIRAFLDDEGDPRMQMDLLMKKDGVGPETFGIYLDLWRQLIGHWEDALGIT